MSNTAKTLQHKPDYVYGILLRGMTAAVPATKHLPARAAQDYAYFDDVANDKSAVEAVQAAYTHYRDEVLSIVRIDMETGETTTAYKFNELEALFEHMDNTTTIPTRPIHAENGGVAWSAA